MFCKQCGLDIDDGSQFCPKCGASQQESAAADTPSAETAPSAPRDSQRGPEEDLWEGGRSWKKYFFHVVFVLILLGGGGTAAFFIEDGYLPGFLKKADQYVKYIPFAVAVIIGLILWIKIFIYTHSVRYRLTSERLFVTTGILSKKIEEIDLYRINDVTLVQSFAERIFGLGNVTVISNDETTPTVKIAGISNSEVVKEHIRNATAMNRKNALFVERI